MPTLPAAWRSPLPLLGLAALVTALALGEACGGGGGISQTQARDRLASATCDFQMGCGQIGPTGTYASRDACLTQTKDFWQGVLTPELCSGRVDGDQLHICETAIRITECANALDVLATLSKCPAAKICPAPGVDAATP